MLLVCIMIGHAAEDDVQCDVEFTIIDRPRQRITEDAGAEVDFSGMPGQVLLARIYQFLPRCQGIVEQGEEYIVNEHGFRHGNSVVEWRDIWKRIEDRG
jgi:hypothetical protein